MSDKMYANMSNVITYVQQLWMDYASVETAFSLIALILANMYIVRSDALYDFIGKILVKLELKIKGQYDHVPLDGESIVSAQRTRASWEMKRDNVAVFAIQGRRPHMEDRFNVVAELEHTNTSIYGIFDGHGGEFAADYVEKTLFKIIMVRLLKAALSNEEPDHDAILTESILAVDEQLLMVERETGEISGTTVLVALVRDNKLYVANVGDSRAVMCSHDGTALPLSFDHKPQQVKERRRIKKAGGFISFNGVWRVAGVLATSRALGDYPLKDRNFVIAEPDILTFDLDESCPQFMIIATDGLWDAFSNEEAVEYIKERLHEPHFGAKSIVLQAYYRGSLDNITVMVVDFTRRVSSRVSTSDIISDSETSSLISDDEGRIENLESQEVVLCSSIEPEQATVCMMPLATSDVEVSHVVEETVTTVGEGHLDSAIPFTKMPLGSHAATTSPKRVVEASLNNDQLTISSELVNPDACAGNSEDGKYSRGDVNLGMVEQVDTGLDSPTGGLGDWSVIESGDVEDEVSMIEEEMTSMISVSTAPGSKGGSVGGSSGGH